MQTNGKDIYVNIKELPLVNEVQAGDFFIVETTQGTNIIDFSNIIIPPENTSFYGEIQQLQTDVAGLSTLYDLQTALIVAVSGELDTKIDSTSAELQTSIDSVSANLYERFYLVGGGVTFDGNSVETTAGVRCFAIRNGVGNYSIVFDDSIATAVASSNQDKTIVLGVDGNVATVQTFQLSYTFDVSGGSGTTAISAIETALSYEPFDADIVTVMGF